MDRTESVTRYFFFTSNILFAVSGGLLLVLGIINVSYDGNSNHELIDRAIHRQDLNVVGYLFVFVGLCIFAATFFGCWATLRTNQSMVLVNGLAMMVLLLIQMFFYGCARYLREENIRPHNIRRSMSNLFDEYEPTVYTDVTRLVDSFQSQYSCCGVTGPEYWNEKYKANTSTHLPPSCCDRNVLNKSMSDQICSKKNAHTKCCMNEVTKAVSSSYRLSYAVYPMIIQVYVIFSTFYVSKELKLSRRGYIAI